MDPVSENPKTKVTEEELAILRRALKLAVVRSGSKNRDDLPMLASLVVAAFRSGLMDSESIAQAAVVMFRSPIPDVSTEAN